jgi:hypothetical protein
MFAPCLVYYTCPMQAHRCISPVLLRFGQQFLFRAAPEDVSTHGVYFWSRLGCFQNSLLQPEHRNMAIPPSGEATASMNVMDLLQAAQSGICLVSRSAIPRNAKRPTRFLALRSLRVPDIWNLVLEQRHRNGDLLP